LKVDGLFEVILNMCFLNIIVTKSKNMIILIIELNKKVISIYKGLFDGYFPFDTVIHFAMLSSCVVCSRLKIYTIIIRVYITYNIP
jgi:hypothetical protein